MQSLLRRYVVIMIRSRLISVSVAGAMLAMTGVELVDTFIAIRTAESFDQNVAVNAVLSVTWVGAAFIGRVIATARIASLPYFAVAISWLLCAVASAAHLETVFPRGGPGSFPIYSLIRPDLLAFWCGLFLLFSILRFIVTVGVAAGSASHEVDSYS